MLYIPVDFARGNTATYLYYITLGAVCMIVIYMIACVGSFVFFKKHRQIKHSFLKHDLAPLVGFVVLAFPLFSDFYPVPQFPLSTFPYFVILWGIIGYLISKHHAKA